MYISEWWLLVSKNSISLVFQIESDKKTSYVYLLFCSLLFFSNLFFSFLNLQTENSPYQYRGMVHAFSTVLKEEGPRALYKGWLPSVIGVVSNTSII